MCAASTDSKFSNGPLIRPEMGKYLIGIQRSSALTGLIGLRSGLGDFGERFSTPGDSGDLGDLGLLLTPGDIGLLGLRSPFGDIGLRSPFGDRGDIGLRSGFGGLFLAPAEIRYEINIIDVNTVFLSIAALWPLISTIHGRCELRSQSKITAVVAVTWITFDTIQTSAPEL